MSRPFKLAIDPGHGFANVRAGQYDSGSVVAHVAEADVVLMWANTLSWVCYNSNIPFWQTRKNDRDPDPVGTRDDRAEAALCTHFLSLHCNEADTSDAHGTEAFYRDNADKAWADICGGAAHAAVNSKWRGLKDESASQHNRLAVFNFHGPCTLVELGFLSNPDDRAKLQSRDVRLAFANNLVAALRAKGLVP